MNGGSKKELQDAVWDATHIVDSIHKLATAADHTLTQAGVDRASVQASLDHDTLIGIANGVKALAEKAIAKLEYLDAALSQQKEAGDAS